MKLHSILYEFYDEMMRNTQIITIWSIERDFWSFLFPGTSLGRGLNSYRLAFSVVGEEYKSLFRDQRV